MSNEEKSAIATPVWWKTGTCYQVWPASFKDSNGDGLGDIPGLISKLDYLKDLGADIIWLSPMYSSPQVDMGYDISNYEDVHPPFGTLQDMEKFIKGLHDRGMRLILDLVINHTSDKHAWFQESVLSRDNPKADWYMWRDPKIVDGRKQPPNNWGAIWGGSAWEYVEARDQYYLHIFEKQMPDLNWENPVTRKAIYDSAIRFWLEKGVDGFRVDVSNLYSKDPTFPDAPIADPNEKYQRSINLCLNGPRIHEFYQEMHREVIDEYGDVMMVGELALTPVDEILKYVAGGRELSMIFDFDVFILGRSFLGVERVGNSDRVYTLPQFKTAWMKTQRMVRDTDGWASTWAENHDSPRSLSRHGSDLPLYRDKAAKALAMLLSTSSGTLFLYQGEEIGMSNIPHNWSVEDLRDVSALNRVKAIANTHPGDKEMQQKIWTSIQMFGRDNARTPVQWDATENAGFTTGKPWMRINDNYEEVNVAAQLEDENSVLSFWKKCLSLRKKHSEWTIQGLFETHDYDNASVFTFTKESLKGDLALVVLNMSTEDAAMEVPSALQSRQLELLIGNVATPGERLEAWEGRVYLVR